MYIQRQMWKQIKTLVFNKKKNLTKSVLFVNVEYNYDRDIVNKFNTYFNTFNTYFIDSISSIRLSIDEVQHAGKEICEQSNLYLQDKYYGTSEHCEADEV